MGDPLSVTLAVASFAGFSGQLFTGCLKLYDVFSGAAHFGEVNDMLLMKLMVQRLKFKIWGEHWNAQEGGIDNAILEEGDDFRDVVNGILLRIQNLLQDAQKVYRKYGLDVEGIPGNPASNLDADAGGHTVFQVEPKDNAREIQKSVAFWKRCKWKVQDQEKFCKLLEDLTSFTDSLYELLPAPIRRSLRLATACATVGAAHSNEIKPMTTVATVEQGPSDGRTPSREPFLTYKSIAELAEIRQFNDILNAEAPSRSIRISSLCVDKTTVQLLGRADSSSNEGFHHRRQLEEVEYKEQKSIVEWKKYNPDLPYQIRLIIYQRMESLAQFLNKPKTTDFRTPRCVAYFHDEVEAQFGYLYNISDFPGENLSWTTLERLLKVKKPRVSDRASLGGRLNLAKVLTVSLLKLHVSGWLHKSLRSDNILLFPKTEEDEKDTERIVDERFDFEHPLIVGFGYSRPDQPDEPTIERSNDPELANDHDLYRHPQLIPSAVSYHRGLRYEKEHDIFSLGLILFELAMQRPLKYFQEQKDTSEAFVQRIKRLVPQLSGLMGNKYRNAVEYCLSAVDEDGSVGRSQIVVTPAPHIPDLKAKDVSQSGQEDAAFDDMLKQKRLESVMDFFWNVVLPLQKCNV
ncbi:hypothetical protein AA313_de0208411 [Arthrobotrys entomopaga]|nr:hypothetical protein AA313_de0208411 [Arthrobotrys entomopaga]